MNLHYMLIHAYHGYTWGGGNIGEVYSSIITVTNHITLNGSSNNSVIFKTPYTITTASNNITYTKGSSTVKGGNVRGKGGKIVFK